MRTRSTALYEGVRLIGIIRHKMARTNWDTDRKRRKPPAWDPPKLLLVVVSGLHVVVGTSSVVGVIVDGGIWLLGSGI